ncbi:uncharacterized protein DUF4325 [Thermodesulfitimonas autotrophica]|uniref:Uncharacterized protein DUF4325 n=1 Tax=Thermodesulfitimonas autotrophica TaxID=1894989 RepID=A0A3N5AX17_9THEO|nr:STAS-like domain-containing protein [Thermodesulfitimonas autotrophica]RPF49569.1 uncharacterized protein DUF4325 [Thermodesulfitimonas autotrophica]
MIKMKEFGTHLTGRALGKKVRELILGKTKESTPVLLDFAGVQMASHSFCDEAIGKMLQELEFKEFKRAVKFVNCCAEIKSIIKFVLRDRLTEKRTCATLV